MPTAGQEIEKQAKIAQTKSLAQLPPEERKRVELTDNLAKRTNGTSSSQLAKMRSGETRLVV